MTGELAGALTQRVTLLRANQARDPLGAVAGWTATGESWAAVTPAGRGAANAADAAEALPVWRVTMRPRPLSPGDRLHWRGRTLELVAVEEDPAAGDRMVVIAAERRG
ncbi:head-tail adaptor [Sphingomonas jejuensis]|uniref:Head-tail adaptor n=1 Tax=Sphingomonas jejuensis TaxID=904715 RepID=A0ABX0XJ37_9SPHN|nr:head-tail adaptor protein [Sphingomonas jejuensis]NJC32821.1 head-tail adaptor [Sphingomonas jejuensis]